MVTPPVTPTPAVAVPGPVRPMFARPMLTVAFAALLLSVTLIGLASVAGWFGPGRWSFAGLSQRHVFSASIDAEIKDFTGGLDPTKLTLAPDALRRVSAEDAVRINMGVRTEAQGNQPAPALVIPIDNPASYLRSADCMTAAIYYEAATEPVDGQRAVAQVILNRVRHPAYPSTVCGVVFQGVERRTGCQFSFTCDGSLARIPSRSGWATARSVALAALAGLVYAPVGLATHYHADYVVPYWAASMLKSWTVGRHIFYRFNGPWGRAGAYAMRYQDNEPDVMGRAADGHVFASINGAGIAPLASIDAVAPSTARPVLANNGTVLKLEEGAAPETRQLMSRTAAAPVPSVAKQVPSPAGRPPTRWVLDMAVAQQPTAQ
ncbi:cell wall hydrolase [soil metagenome]